MLRATKVPEDLLDVITYGLIDDPVIAEDNFTYSRQTITDWYRQCKIDGEPVTSPMYRTEVGETLRPNYPLLQKLEEFKRNGIDTSIVKEREAPSIALLAKVFEVIDPIRDLFASMKWQPPALVVLGNEKSGKSTLLERLAMMPIFPKAKQICTRLAIHVRLRRGPSKPPLVEVYDKISGTVLRDVVIPMEKGNEYVQDAMERVLKAENDGIIRGVSNKKVLILHVSSPMAPNLDLVDLPGLVSTYVRDEPENMQEMTRQLVEDYIKDHATHSIYLVTIPASTATNQSLAMDIVQRHKLHARTIGVLTKSDQYSTFDDDEVERSEIVRDLSDKVFQRSADVVQLPAYGYVATMNKPVRHGTFNTNYGSLMYQAEREKDWFNEKGFSEIVDAGHATIASLINRLSSVYHDYMRDTWAPLTILKLEAERLTYSQKEIALGLPRADQFLEEDNSNDSSAPLEGKEATTGSLESTQPPPTAIPSSRTVKGNEGRVHRDKISSLASELTMSLIRNYRPALVDLLCSKVLKKFQASILSHSVHKKCSPTDAIDLQRNAKIGLEKLCANALDSLQVLVVEELTKVVYSDASGFCLSRFPNYLNAVLDNCTKSLGGWRKDTENTMLNYVAMAFQNLPINPNLSIKYNFDKSEPVAIFSFNSTSLSDVLPHVLVLRLSALMSDILNSSVQSAAQNTDISFWTENCAKERKALLQSMTMMEEAEEQLMQVLSISQDDFETYKKREIESKRAAAMTMAAEQKRDVTTVAATTTTAAPSTAESSGSGSTKPAPSNSIVISPTTDSESGSNSMVEPSEESVTSSSSEVTTPAAAPAPVSGFQKRPLVAPSEETYEAPAAAAKPLPAPVPQVSPLQSSLDSPLDSFSQVQAESQRSGSDERRSNPVTISPAATTTAPAPAANTPSSSSYSSWIQPFKPALPQPTPTTAVSQPQPQPQQNSAGGSTTAAAPLPAPVPAPAHVSVSGTHHPQQSNESNQSSAKPAPAPGSMIRMLMERGVTITGAPLPNVSAAPSQPVIHLPSSVSTPSPATIAVTAAANSAVAMVGHPSGFPLSYTPPAPAPAPAASSASHPPTSTATPQFTPSTHTPTHASGSSTQLPDLSYSSPPRSSSGSATTGSSFPMPARTPTAIYSTYSPYNSTTSPAAALEIFGMPGDSATGSSTGTKGSSSIMGNVSSFASRPLSTSTGQSSASSSVFSLPPAQTTPITAATYFSSGGSPAEDSPFSPSRSSGTALLEMDTSVVRSTAATDVVLQPTAAAAAAVAGNPTNESDKADGLFQLPNPASLTLPNIPNLSGWFWNPAQDQSDSKPPSQGAE